jgi:sialic acid synthase SpsE/spore coat polysaccharide biosynthesis protein SpsF (cytidylyltransferase family)
MAEIIAEIANAHQGSPQNAEKLALKCLEAGVDAIKFQIYFADELLVKNHPKYLHFKKQSFNQREWSQIINKVKKNGKVYCDIFGLKSFALAKKLRVDGYKIHSSDLLNYFLLKKICKEKKKIFLSTGGSRIPEIKYALNFFQSSKKKPILLHGFQSYPTKIEDVKLKRILDLKNYFKSSADVGYQDHTSGDDPFNLYLPLIAIGMGACVIEKHVTLNRKKKGTDYYSSIEPKNLKKFVEIIRKSERALGKNIFSFTKSESDYRSEVKKYWVSNIDFPKKKITKKNTIMKRVHLKKFEPFYYEDIDAAEIKKNIKKDEIINFYNINKKNVAIIVARTNSQRLKKKAYLKINGKTTIDHLIKRTKLSKKIDLIILCTTKKKDDDKMVGIAKKNKILFYRGAEKDVLKRIIYALKKIKNVGSVIRITGDDIMVDPYYIDKSIFEHNRLNADYTSSKNLPSGTEVEVFKYRILKLIFNISEDTSGSEYLTNYIHDNKDCFKMIKTRIDKEHKIDCRLTIDTIEDFFLVKKLLEHMKKINKEYNYTISDIKKFFIKFPKLSEINKDITQKRMPLKYNTKLDWEKNERI